MFFYRGVEFFLVDKSFKGIGGVFLADFYQQVDEGDLNQRSGLVGEGVGNTFFNGGGIGKNIERFNGGESHVDVGVVVEDS